MPDTLGSLRAEVQDWLAGDTVPDARINTAINDGIESLWLTLIRACLSIFMGGPSNVSFSAASERTTLVSITDPTAAPAASNVAGGALGNRNYFITFTYATESGTETLESLVNPFAATLNNLCQVQSPAFSEGAIGWNCYAGSVTGRRAKQNDEPIRFGDDFLEPESGFSDEPQLPSPPIENTTGDNIFYIRHLELLTTS